MNSGWENHPFNGRSRWHYRCKLEKRGGELFHVWELAVSPVGGSFEVFQPDSLTDPETKFSYAKFDDEEELRRFLRLMHIAAIPPTL